MGEEYNKLSRKYTEQKNEKNALFENYRLEFDKEKSNLINDIKQKVINVTETERKLIELNSICKNNESH